jgi:uncharacterized cupredoxin-like copper-binding protein
MRRLWLGLVLYTAVAGCSDFGRPVQLRGDAEWSASMLDFGTVALLDSAERRVTVRNTGNADLRATPRVSCAEFRLIGGSGEFTLAPGDSRELVLRFRPAGAGAFACELDLGAGLPTVRLEGAAVLQEPGAACTVSADTLRFGEVRVGQLVFRTFMVRSVGTAPARLNVVATCADASVIGGGATTLAPGESLEVTVVLQPASGGALECAVAVGPGCPEVALSGFRTSVSFAGDIQPIFDAHCVHCHGYAAPGLAAQISYDEIVRAPSPTYRALRVKPFDPDSSVLYGKVANSRRYGPMMPLFGPLLPPGSRERIRTWIAEGARDN